ncbi:carbohydrate kinase family protein [Candidatus Gottesmanbacteria bacterium]|nr:carbohydrate kinase family protein [Candidatus Gottesmanbacteria bacterium]MBI5465272.1 carbohydrate kinase family protein [Candidatus Gottesmanbacteria bacterium]
MKIIVTGSLAFDFIMDFPGKFGDHILPEKIHQINLSFLVKDMKKQYGGTAGNIAYNLALLGLRPTVLATAGNDFAEYRKELVKVGVDDTVIRIAVSEPTASAFIFTDMVDNQITGFYPGAMSASAKLKIKNEKLKINKDDFVVIAPNEPRAMIKYAKECQNLGIPYLFDPGMQLPRLKTQDLRLGVEGAKIVIGNDYEISLIQKRLDTSDGVRSPAPSGAGRSTPPRWRNQGQIWITTLGEKGSIIESGGKIYKISPARPRQVLDPTGAGDAYRAGFLAGYLRGLPLEICGRMGSVAAVYTVEKYGTQTHKFTKKEFCQRYEENFGEKLKLPKVSS